MMAIDVYEAEINFSRQSRIKPIKIGRMLAFSKRHSI